MGFRLALGSSSLIFQRCIARPTDLRARVEQARKSGTSFSDSSFAYSGAARPVVRGADWMVSLWLWGTTLILAWGKSLTPEQTESPVSFFLNFFFSTNQEIFFIR